jgi:hypothetical protein
MGWRIGADANDAFVEQSVEAKVDPEWLRRLSLASWGEVYSAR